MDVSHSMVLQVLESQEQNETFSERLGQENERGCTSRGPTKIFGNQRLREKGSQKREWFSIKRYT